MDYQEWERNVPADITGDVLWKLRAYRLALFVGDPAWSDVTSWQPIGAHSRCPIRCIVR